MSASNPPGFQPSGAAYSSSANAVASPGPGSATPASSGSLNTVAVADKLKIFSVIFGLIDVVLIAYAYNNAAWFRAPEEKQQYCPNPKDYSSCYETYLYQDDVCDFTNKRSDKTVYHACPSRWLVIPQLFIIAFTWAGTFIVLIVLLFANLSKSTAFPKIDMIGHFIAAGLAIVSGLCLFGYTASVWYRGQCWREDFPQRRYIRTSEENMSNTTATGRQNGYYNGPTCSEIESIQFTHYHVLFGALFAFITAGLYIMIALKSKKGQQVRPMMGKFGAPAQTQSTPNQMQQSPAQAPPKA